MSDIETRLFRYFVALAEELHFGRAAASLNISPPTLTNQIQKLEKRVGVMLVERRGNTHVEITDAGRRFLERARNVLREAAEAEAVARQAARGETGRLEIGFMMVVSLSGLVEKFIGGFHRDNPGIELLLQHMITVEQIRAVLERNLDFGFVRPPERYPSDLQGIIVYRQPMILAIPKDHPLAKQKCIAPASLKNEAFINTGPGLDSGFWKHTESVGTLGNFAPRIVKRSKDMVSVLSYVSAGEGIGIVSKALVRFDMPNVVYREFKTDKPPVSELALIYRRNETTPAAKLFIESVRRRLLQS